MQSEFGVWLLVHSEPFRQETRLTGAAHRAVVQPPLQSVKPVERHNGVEPRGCGVVRFFIGQGASACNVCMGLCALFLWGAAVNIYSLRLCEKPFTQSHSPATHIHSHKSPRNLSNSVTEQKQTATQTVWIPKP